MSTFNISVGSCARRTPNSAPKSKEWAQPAKAAPQMAKAKKNIWKQTSKAFGLRSSLCRTKATPKGIAHTFVDRRCQRLGLKIGRNEDEWTSWELCDREISQHLLSASFRMFYMSSLSALVHCHLPRTVQFFLLGSEQSLCWIYLDWGPSSFD